MRQGHERNGLLVVQLVGPEGRRFRNQYVARWFANPFLSCSLEWSGEPKDDNVINYQLRDIDAVAAGRQELPPSE